MIHGNDVMAKIWACETDLKRWLSPGETRDLILDNFDLHYARAREYAKDFAAQRGNLQPWNIAADAVPEWARP